MAGSDNDANNSRGETSPEAGGLDDLAERLGDLARVSQDEDGVDETLQAIVDAAVGTVPGAHAVRRPVGGETPP